jgi:hypothetical protein
MPAVAVSIVAFVDPAQPGFVRCVLRDAFGTEYAFVEKVPVVSLDDLDSHSRYPRPGSIECEVVDRWRDGAGRPLATIHVRGIAPDGDPSRMTFDVIEDQIRGR